MSAFIRPSHFGFVFLFSLVAGLAAADVQSSVANPTKRHDSLETAKALLAVQPVVLPAELINPFNPAAFAEATGTVNRNPGNGTAGTATQGAAEPAPVKPAGPKTDRDIIQAIAAALKPSGFFVLGGEPTLVFGQKRVKAGGHVTITFEGTEYTLDITSIDRPNFTLRLNREVFTRPIK